MLFIERKQSMPPIPKFSKEDILNCAYEIVKKEGFEGLNARKIAKVLGCSVQPIFHNFTSMEELNKEVHQLIYHKYQEYMLSAKEKEDNPYKQMGLSYIKFASDYPEFFKILFMQKTNLNANDFVMTDSIGEDVIKTGQMVTGLSYEEQKKFHVKVWIFTHGIACLVATKTIQFTKEEIEELLAKSIKEMLIGYKKEKKNEGK